MSVIPRQNLQQSENHVRKIESVEIDTDVQLTSGARSCAAIVAIADIGIIWAFFFWHDWPVASGLYFRGVLQGSILLSLPFLALLAATLMMANWTAGLLSASVALLSLFFFPILGFVSWFTTNRAGPMVFLAPTSLALFAPAINALRGLSGKPKFIIWTAVLVVALGCFFWFSVQVYLGQSSLYVPCDPNVPCHLRL